MKKALRPGEEEEDDTRKEHDMQTYCIDDHLDPRASKLLNFLMILCAVSTCLIHTLHYLQQPGEQSLYAFQVERRINSDLSSKFKIFQ